MRSCCRAVFKFSSIWSERVGCVGVRECEEEGEGVRAKCKENYVHGQRVRVASFPGPAQLSVACSTVKRERAWYLFSRE